MSARQAIHGITASNLSGYAGSNTALAIFMLLLTSGLNILVTPGCKSNVVDIAPAYSGIHLHLAVRYCDDFKYRDNAINDTLILIVCTIVHPQF